MYRFGHDDVGGKTAAERLRLRNLAHALELWNENTGALSKFDIDPLPHQIHLVHHILGSGNLNWLIADDVGLGKTIEAGLLIAALRQRNAAKRVLRSEEHTSELQSLMRISYAVFCLKKKKQ